MLHSLVAFTALTNGRLRRLAVRRKLEEACWSQNHAHCRHLCRRRPRHANRTTWTSDLCRGVILPETGQFLLLCSLQLWQQLQRCRQTRARVQICWTHFTSVLRKQFAVNDTFLREMNGYKWALALRMHSSICLSLFTLLRTSSLVTVSSQMISFFSIFTFQRLLIFFCPSVSMSTSLLHTVLYSTPTIKS